MIGPCYAPPGCCNSSNECSISILLSRFCQNIDGRATFQPHGVFIRYTLEQARIIIFYWHTSIFYVLLARTDILFYCRPDEAKRCTGIYIFTEVGQYNRNRTFITTAATSSPGVHNAVRSLRLVINKTVCQTNDVRILNLSIFCLVLLNVDWEIFASGNFHISNFHVLYFLHLAKWRIF